MSAQQGRKPVNLKGDLPAPFATPSVRNNATIVAKPEGAALASPPGFVVEEFMDMAGTRPRFMMLGPGNEILISDTSGNGNVFVIKDGVRIGAGTVVGAGSLVLRDLPDEVVAFGSPATIVRSLRHAEAAHR